MPVNWLGLAALGGLASNAFNFINRFTLRGDSDSTVFAWWFEFVRFSLFFAIAVFDFFLILNWNNIILLLALGLTELIAVYFFMRMHSHAELSLSSVILNLRLVWVPLIAFLVIGERLSAGEYLGILIIFSGLSLVTSPRRLALENGVKLAFLSSIITAVLTVIMKMCSQIASTPVIMASMSLPSAVLIPILMKSSKPRISKTLSQIKKNGFLAAVFNLVSMYLMLWSMRLGPVGKSLAIFQAMSLVSVLVGIVFLRERKNFARKVAGSMVTILGAWFLA